jgi:hypothetical protein
LQLIYHLVKRGFTLEGAKSIWKKDKRRHWINLKLSGS